jgi:hypothetical protein|tara:strand:+ start:1161 stop:1511 length:351 start_codon:yes stop_codon:yes gene_type:complete
MNSGRSINGNLLQTQAGALVTIGTYSPKNDNTEGLDMSTESPVLDIKAPLCPNCGSVDVAAILYGHPACSEEINLDLESNQTVLGGCCEIYEKAPEWCCTKCNHQFGACASSEDGY